MTEQDYNIKLDEKYPPLTMVDLPGLLETVDHPWFNQTLNRVNDCVVRVGVFEKGEFHWHKHDIEDEFFFVLEGEFIIEIEGETIALQPQQGYTIPKGVMHRTRVQKPATILMMEGKGVQPTGD